MSLATANTPVAEQAMRHAPLALGALREPFVDILQRRGSNVPGWIGALVASVDGRQIAIHHNDVMDAARVAAMVGSVVALGDTVCRELKFGRSQSLIVSAGGGHLLALRIPARREVLVLGVLTSASATLGLVLHEARICAQDLAACFDQQQALQTSLPP
jgi:predicted regulator of Ras-like GTPase activity (Roadblock/LC7/MglB family)